MIGLGKGTVTGAFNNGNFGYRYRPVRFLRCSQPGIRPGNEALLLMATRNPAKNQLRLVVYRIIYRVLAPSQVVQDYEAHHCPLGLEYEAGYFLGVSTWQPRGGWGVVTLDSHDPRYECIKTCSIETNS